MKTKLSLLALLSLLLSCCSGGGKTGNADSAEVAETERETKEFSSPDLSMQELQGHVRLMVLTAQWLETNPDGSKSAAIEAPNEVESFLFDTEGHLCEYHCASFSIKYNYDEKGDYTGGNLVSSKGETLSIEREFDSAGRLLMERAVTAPNQQSELAFEIVYTWSDIAPIRSEFAAWETRIVKDMDFNDKHLLTVTREKVTDVGYEAQSNLGYSYRTFDDCGNWTEREVTVSTVPSREDGVAVVDVPQQTYSRLEKRSIEYFK